MLAQHDRKTTSKLYFAAGAAAGSNNVADLGGGGEVASGHDIYLSGKYHGFLKNVYKNIPLGNINALSYRICLNEPRLRPQHIADLFKSCAAAQDLQSKMYWTCGPSKFYFEFALCARRRLVK